MAILDWLEPEAFYLWRRRVQAERAARHLTPLRRDALLALLARIGPDGLYPADKTVAADASCSSRTVRRARVDARALGLLSWGRTRRRMADGRWRQGPNSYDLAVPDAPVCPMSPRRRQIRVRTASPRLTRSAKQQLSALGITVMPNVDLLAARRAQLNDRARGCSHVANSAAMITAAHIGPREYAIGG